MEIYIYRERRKGGFGFRWIVFLEERLGIEKAKLYTHEPSAVIVVFICKAKGTEGRGKGGGITIV